MSDFLLYASVVALFLVCILVVLVILMQRPSANAGMGSALGGGAAETVFGGESANVLSKMTTTLTVILFVLSFGLYLGFVAREKPVTKALDAKATAPVAAPAAPAAPASPAAPAAATPAAPKAPVAAPSVPAPAAAKPQSTPAPAATTPAKPAAPAPAK
jgi:preprotein translocase subunit SecG